MCLSDNIIFFLPISPPIVSCNSLKNRQCRIEKELSKAHTECMRISRRFLPQRDPWHPNLFKPSNFPDASPGCQTGSCLTTWTCIRKIWHSFCLASHFSFSASVSLSVIPLHLTALFSSVDFRYLWSLINILCFKKNPAFYSIGLPCCQHYPQWTLSLIVSLGLSVTPATHALDVFYLCSWAQWDSNCSAQTEHLKQLSCLLWVSIVFMHA